MRAAIGRRMTQSKQSAPHIYLSAEIGLDAAIAALGELNAGRAADDRITVTAVLIRAIALTLRDEPAFNAHWTDAGPELIDEVNIGVAIALDEGLIAPALLGCDRLDAGAISAALRDLTARARTGKLRARELADGTFTLSNLGAFEVSAFAAIINPPQVAILATGRAAPRPVVVDGAVVVRTLLTATLSADHRAVDGAAAARFLGRLKSRLEGPDGWLAADG
jgi:pyruvate dehydrogenase E2 component (dihydrolipoamide acetyltransferase)